MLAKSNTVKDAHLPQTLVILAAGMGSRYGGIKQLDRFGPRGQTLMEYAIEDAVRAGFGKVVFTIRKSFHEDFKKQIIARFEGRVEMACVFQEIAANRVKPWGPAEALLVARDEVPGDFAMINADDFYGREAFIRAREFLLTSKDIAAIIGYPLAETLSDSGGVNRGICKLNSEGYLVEIFEGEDIQKIDGRIFKNASPFKAARPAADQIEHRPFKNDPAQSLSNELDGELLVSMNMMAFRQSFFDYLNQSFSSFSQSNAENLKAELNLPMVLNPMVKPRNPAVRLGYDQATIATELEKVEQSTSSSSQRKVKVLASGSKWFGVTYADDKQRVAEKLLALEEEYTS